MKRTAILFLLFFFALLMFSPASTERISKTVMGFYQHELEEYGDFASYPRVTKIYVWYYPSENSVILAYYGGIIKPEIHGLMLDPQQFRRICNKEIYDDSASLGISDTQGNITASYAIKYSVSVFETFIFLAGLDTARGGIGIKITNPRDYGETLYILDKDLKVACSVLSSTSGKL